jgi:methionyl-tRNA formyltransferase
MPDKCFLRHRKPTYYQSVKIYAIENNISFVQPEKFTDDTINRIKNFAPDIGIVVAYSKIIPKIIFNIPRYRTFNIHFSLLPKYKGAAPVQWALYNGECETGVSSFYISERLDAGDIIIQEKININMKDNAKTLFDKLIPLGIDIMNETIKLEQTALLNSKPQVGHSSFAPILKKNNGLVDWSKDAHNIYNQFRGLYLWPGIYSIIPHGKLSGKMIKFIEIEIFDDTLINKDFGKICSVEKHKGFTISCAVGKILVIKLQLENKRIMSAWDFIQGRQLFINDHF